LKGQIDVEFSVGPMDGKLLKSSFQWFKCQIIWSSLQRVMTILVDSGQLKWRCLEFCFYYMFLLRILRVMSKVINRFVFRCKQVREEKKCKRNRKYSLNKKKFQNYSLFLPLRYIIFYNILYHPYSIKNVPKITLFKRRMYNSILSNSESHPLSYFMVYN
jgi:hypothetical protein